LFGLNRISYSIRQAEEQGFELAQDVRILADWMQNDILSTAGPDLQSRQELYDFVVQQLRERENLYPHRIGPVHRMLENHRDNLLAFVGVLDERFTEIAAKRKTVFVLRMSYCVLRPGREYRGKYGVNRDWVRRLCRPYVRLLVCDI